MGRPRPRTRSHQRHPLRAACKKRLTRSARRARDGSPEGTPRHVIGFLRLLVMSRSSTATGSRGTDLTIENRAHGLSDHPRVEREPALGAGAARRWRSVRAGGKDPNRAMPELDPTALGFRNLSRLTERCLQDSKSLWSWWMDTPGSHWPSTRTQRFRSIIRSQHPREARSHRVLLRSRSITEPVAQWTFKPRVTASLP